ncbi:MAG: hypothetical protein Q8R79_05280 [Legionellaceae bacterium]|nr:hypothetical protein [Legionellaceae bacterium]
MPYKANENSFKTLSDIQKYLNNSDASLALELNGTNEHQTEDLLFWLLTQNFSQKITLTCDNKPYPLSEALPALQAQKKLLQVIYQKKAKAPVFEIDSAKLSMVRKDKPTGLRIEKQKKYIPTHALHPTTTITPAQKSTPTPTPTATPMPVIDVSLPHQAPSYLDCLVLVLQHIKVKGITSRMSRARQLFTPEFYDVLIQTPSLKHIDQLLLLLADEKESTFKKHLERLKKLHLYDEKYAPLLTSLLLRGDISYVSWFLDQIERLPEEQRTFLQQAHIADSLLTPEGIETLETLCQMPLAAQTWWNQIATKHPTPEGNAFPFTDYFQQFQYFLSILRDHQWHLPADCALQSTEKLPDLLKSMLKVLEKSANPRDQITYLDKLHWDSESAPLSVETYQQIHPSMQLSPGNTLNVSPESEIVLHLENKTIKDMVLWFYRRAGQCWHPQLSAHELESFVQTLEEFSEAEQKYLLFLSAAVTFKKTKTLTLPSKTLQDFISCYKRFKPLLPEESLLKKLINIHHTPEYWDVNKIQHRLHSIEQFISKAELDSEKEAFCSLAMDLFQDNPLMADVFFKNYEAKKPILKETLHANSFLTLLKSWEATRASLQNAFPHEKDYAAFCTLLSALEPAPTPSGIIELSEQFKATPQHSLLLYALTHINVQESSTLPSTQNILAILNTFKPLSAVNTTPEATKTFLDEAFKKENPGIFLGERSGNPESLSMLSVIKIVICENLDINSSENKIPNMFRGSLSTELNILKKLDFTLQNTTLSAEEQLAKSFEILADLEEKCTKTKGKNPNLWKAGLFATKKLPEKDKFVHEWLKSYEDYNSLSPMFKDKILELLRPHVENLLRTLNTHDDEFEAGIRAQIDIPEEKLKTPSSKMLKEYNQQTMTQVLPFLEILLALKSQDSLTNKDSACFPICLEKLKTPMLSQLAFKQKASLVTTLVTIRQKNTGNSTALSMQEQFDILIDELQQSKSFLALIEKKTNEKEKDAQARFQQAQKCFQNVLVSLDTLPELSALPHATQETLCRIGIHHGLNHEHPISLPLLAKISQLSDLPNSTLPKGQTKLLFQKMVHVIQECHDAEAQLQLKDILENTHALLSQTPLPAANGLVAELLQEFNHANPETYEQYLSGLIQTLLKKINPDKPETYNEYLLFLETLSQPNLSQEERTLYMSFVRKLCLSADPNLGIWKLTELLRALKQHPLHLIDIHKKLFAYPPYPKINALLEVAREEKDEKLKAFIHNFDLYPLKEQTQRNLEEHFDTSRIIPNINEITNLLEKLPLSAQKRYEILKDSTYIQIIGHNPTYSITQNGKSLVEISREELKKEFDDRVKILRNPNIEKKKTAQLELIAILRELFFRATGLFPKTTQILSLLLSLEYPDNLLMQIKTGQGKSLITPLLAVLQYAKKEGPINICTANRVLLEQDYNKMYKDFFTILDIPHRSILSDSEPNTSASGMNCSTLEDLCKYKLAAGERQGKEPEEAAQFILDESDTHLLTGQTYTLIHTPEFVDEEHDLRWIYPLIYNFSQSDLYTKINPEEGAWSPAQDIDRLKVFLQKHAQGPIQQKQALEFSDERWDEQCKVWLRNACKAAQLQEKEHFIIQKIGENSQYYATPLGNNPSDSDPTQDPASFGDGLHPFLHARLNIEHAEKGWRFLCEAESVILASQSAQDFILQSLRAGGRLIGISGTPGDNAALQEMYSLFKTQAIAIPTHDGTNRTELKARITAAGNAHVLEIISAIAEVKSKRQEPEPTIKLSEIPKTPHLDTNQFSELLQKKWGETQTQPVLIITPNIKAAETLHASLQEYAKKNYFTLQVITGQEDSETRKALLANAGKPNHITIGTPILERGIDILPQHQDGVFCIQTFIAPKDSEEQIKGRSARNKKNGRYIAIYPDNDGTLLKKHLGFFPALSKEEQYQCVQKIQKNMTQEATTQRFYTRQTEIIKNILLAEWTAWKALSHDISKTDDINQQFYADKGKLLSKLGTLYKPNTALKKLDAAVKEYEHQANKIWTELRQEWIQHIESEKTPALSTEQKWRLECLKSLQLQEALKTQIQIHDNITSYQAQTEALIESQMESILNNPAAVVASYQTLSAEQTLQFQKEADICTVEQIQKNIQKNFSADALQKLQEEIQKKPGTETALKTETETTLKTEYETFQEEWATLTKTNDADTLKKQVHALLAFLLNIKKAAEELPLKSKYQLQIISKQLSDIDENMGYSSADPALKSQFSDLKNNYHRVISKTLAKRLLMQLNWASRSHRGLSWWFESQAQCEAARKLWECANDLQDANPESSEEHQAKLYALYKTLEKERLTLQYRTRFSIGHVNPRILIEQTIQSIEALNYIPDTMRNTLKTEAMYEVHAQSLQKTIKSIHNSYSKDMVWLECQQSILNILSDEENAPKLSKFDEVHAYTESLLANPAYAKYKTPLKKILRKCTISAKNTQECFLDPLFWQTKAQRLHKLYHLPATAFLSIQPVHTGQEPYIEMITDQLSEEHPLLKGQTIIQYKSHILPMLTAAFADTHTQLESLTVWKNAFALNKALVTALPKEFQAPASNINILEDLSDKPENCLTLEETSTLFYTKKFAEGLYTLKTTTVENLNDTRLTQLTDNFNCLKEQLSMCNNPSISTNITKTLNGAQQNLDKLTEIVVQRKNIFTLRGTIEELTQSIEQKKNKNMLETLFDKTENQSSLTAKLNDAKTTLDHTQKSLQENLKHFDASYKTGLSTQLKESISILLKELAASAKTSLNVKIKTHIEKEQATINEKIAEENKKSSVKIVRFNNPKAWSAFEAKLPHQTKAKEPPADPLILNLPFKLFYFGRQKIDDLKYAVGNIGTEISHMIERYKPMVTHMFKP